MVITDIPIVNAPADDFFVDGRTLGVGTGVYVALCEIGAGI